MQDLASYTVARLRFFETRRRLAQRASGSPVNNRKISIPLITTVTELVLDVCNVRITSLESTATTPEEAHPTSKMQFFPTVQTKFEAWISLLISEFTGQAMDLYAY